jgi:uncharacterized phiE125 gp8 family phage protein
MRCVRITQPEAEPVTIDEVLVQAKIDHNDEDDLVAGLISRTREFVEDYCGIAIMASDWRLTLNGFYEKGGGIIELPRPPLVDVIQVSYVDTAGVQQDVAIVDNSFARIADAGLLSCISPAINSTWPATANVPGSVQVDYTAGYADPEDVPGVLKHAIILLCAQYHKNREAILIGGSAMTMPFGVDALLRAHKVPVIC